MRTAGAIPYGAFHRLVGKCVRHGHVQTDEHWLYDRPTERNELA